MTCLSLSYKNIQKIENLPNLLTEFYCGGNQIQKIENLPSNLTGFYCESNQIRKIENLPSNLSIFYCWCNQIQKIENLPNNLTRFWCNSNKIQKIENLPLGLRFFECCVNPIVSIDNVSIQDVKFELYNYSNFKRLQNCIKRNFKRRTIAAKIIQKGSYNWVFKAVCKDSTLGINYRIGLRDLQADGLLTK